MFPRTNAPLRGNRVMNKKFQKLVEALDPKFKLLMTMMPVSAATVPNDAPEQAVYLFSENGLDMYVGRTNTLRRRMWQHSSPSAAQNQASLAFRLAQQLTGITTEGGRAARSKHPIFAEAFLVAKAQVRHMELRYVEEANPFRQALLEMYASIALNTPHNDFETH